MKHLTVFKLQTIILIALMMKSCLADFSCLCNYSPESAIYDGDNTSANKIGYMYEFDCKEKIEISTQDGWTAIAFAHMISYVHSSHSQLMFQMCRGEPPNSDVLYSSTKVIQHTSQHGKSYPTSRKSTDTSFTPSYANTTPSIDYPDNTTYHANTATTELHFSTPGTIAETSKNKTTSKSTVIPYFTTNDDISKSHVTKMLFSLSTNTMYLHDNRTHHSSSYLISNITAPPYELTSQNITSRQTLESNTGTTINHITRNEITSKTNENQEYSTAQKLFTRPMPELTDTSSITDQVTMPDFEHVSNSTTVIRSTLPPITTSTNTSYLYSILHSIVLQNTTRIIPYSTIPSNNFTRELISNLTTKPTVRNTGLSNTSDMTMTNTTILQGNLTTPAKNIISNITFVTNPPYLTSDVNTINITVPTPFSNYPLNITDGVYSSKILTTTSYHTSNNLSSNVSFPTNFSNIANFTRYPTTDVMRFTNFSTSTGTNETAHMSNTTLTSFTLVMNITSPTIQTLYSNTTGFIPTNVIFHSNKTIFTNSTSEPPTSSIATTTPSPVNATETTDAENQTQALTQNSSNSTKLMRYSTSIVTKPPTHYITSTTLYESTSVSGTTVNVFNTTQSLLTQVLQQLNYTSEPRTSKSPPEPTKEPLINDTTTFDNVHLSSTQTVMHSTRLISQSTSTFTSTNSVLSGRTDICPYTVLAQTNFTKGIGYIYMRQYGQFCYELRPYSADWLKADKDCKSRKGGLVVITDAAVQQVVHGLLKTLPSRTDGWIGLQDIQKSGQWTWLNGQKLSPTGYSNWMSIYADSVYSRRQGCVTMDAATGKWKIAVCAQYLLDNQKHPWVCQYKIS